MVVFTAFPLLLFVFFLRVYFVIVKLCSKAFDWTTRARLNRES
jgi:hypothetical protein